MDEPQFSSDERLAAVLALHSARWFPVHDGAGGVVDGHKVCAECRQFWPCATATTAGVQR